MKIDKDGVDRTLRGKMTREQTGRLGKVIRAWMTKDAWRVNLARGLDLRDIKGKSLK